LLCFFYLLLPGVLPFLSPARALGQAVPDSGMPVQVVQRSGHPMLPGEVSNPLVQYAGSPYLFDRWTPGRVLMHDRTMVESDHLRYDALNDHLLWMVTGENEQVIVDAGLIRGFLLKEPGSDNYLEFRQNDCLGLDGLRCDRCFVQVLHQGKVSLYVQRSKRITSRTETVVHGGEARQMRLLDDDPRYFLQLPGEETRQIRLGRRSFLSAFPSHGRMLRRALRQAGIQVNEEADLLRAVKWLNATLDLDPGFLD